MVILFLVMMDYDLIDSFILVIICHSIGLHECVVIMHHVIHVILLPRIEYPLESLAIHSRTYNFLAFISFFHGLLVVLNHHL